MAFTVPYTLYYHQPSGVAYSAFNARYAIGVDPSNMDVSVRPSYGFYTVNQAEPTFSTYLNDVGDPIYTINGDYADQTWTAIPHGLSKAKDEASALLKATTSQAILESSEADNFGDFLLIAIASVPSGARKSSFNARLDVMKEQSDWLGDQLGALTAANTFDEVVDITYPPIAVGGTLTITRNGDDLTDATFSVALAGLDTSQVSLVIDGNAYAYDDAAGTFPPTVGAWPGSPYTFSLMYSVYTLASGEVTTNNTPKDFPISWSPTIAPPTL